MAKTEVSTLLEQQLAKLRRAWRWIRRTTVCAVVGDTRGVTLVIVAVLLGTLSLLVAYFLNVAGMLVARTKLQSIAEFSSAGAGRVVAEAIAKRASDNVENGIFFTSDSATATHPELFLTQSDRDELQADLLLQSRVITQARYYAQKNNTFQWSDIVSSLQIEYPHTINSCDGMKQGDMGRQNTIEVTVVVNHEEPLFLERLAVLVHGSPTLRLSANSFYSVPLCP